VKPLRDDLRGQMPGLASRSLRQPKTAIKLFCYECMGGNIADARSCTLRSCFLWPHSPAARAARKCQALSTEGVSALSGPESA